MMESKNIKMLPWRKYYSELELEISENMQSRGSVKDVVHDKSCYFLRVRSERVYEVMADGKYDPREGYFKIYGASCECQNFSKGIPCIHLAASLWWLENTFGSERVLISSKIFGEDPEEYASEENESKRDMDAVILASEEKREMKSNAATEEKTVGALPDLSSISPDMAELVAEERKNGLEAAGTQESGKALADYRYFHMDEIMDGLHLSKVVQRKAQKLIDEGKIEISSFRLEEIRLGEHPYEKGDLITAGNLQLSSAGRYYGMRFPVNMLFHPDYILDSTCNCWDCRHERDEKSYMRRTLCEHEVAGLMLLREYLERHTTYDSTTDRAKKMILALSGLSGTEVTGGKSLKREAIRLEPQIEMMDDDTLYCSFRTGTGRLYKIKNLHEFCDKMKKGGHITFTAKAGMDAAEQDLAEESRPWYDFLTEEMQEESVRYGRYSSRYYVPLSTDLLALEGARMDRFLELGMGMTLPVSVRGEYNRREKESWTLRDKPLSLELSIAPDEKLSETQFEGIVVEGKAPAFFRGLHAGCWIESHYLNRVGAEDLERLRPVLEGADPQGNICLRVGRYNLADFYHKALPELKKIASVTEKDSKIISSYLPPEPGFTIYLDRDNDSFLCRAEGAYGQEIFSLSDATDPAMQKNYQQYRDRSAEERITRAVEEYFPGFDDELKIYFVRRDAEEAYDLLEHGLDELTELPNCKVKMTDRFRRMGLRRKLQFDVGVSLDGNLMDLSVTARELSEDEMLDVLYQYQKKRRFVVLKNGDFLKIEDNESIQHLVQMMEDLHLSVKEFTKGKMNLPAYRALYLDKMLEEQEDFYSERDRHFKELIKGFKTVADSDYEVPQHLKKIMRSYQKEGYRWLRTLDHYGFGGILADEMGLGKTLQTLAVLEAVKQEEAQLEEMPHTSLVVCPASLVYNWLEEAHRFAPSLKAMAVTGTAAVRAETIRNAAETDLLITSYDLLKRDIAEYDGMQFRFEIIDEAQYIKTHTTAAAKSVKLIRAITKFALTGTPIENRLSELWSIFDYLMPGFLFSYDSFRNQIEIPIVKNENADILERLHRMIGSFILRRNKRDVLKDLPDKLEEIRYAGMTGKQQELYDAQVIRMRNNLKDQDENDFRKSKIEVLAELMRIRQICCDPSLCYTNYDGESAKTDLCMELLRNLMDGGHRTLLFSQFTSMLEILQKCLDAENIPYYTITGSTSKEERLRLVKAFNENEIPVFLISLKAGGTGLNLVGADSVIHYDPWWNTAAEDQASDRAHRIGQKNVVTVYKLVVKGTIEEKIVALQQQKAKLASDILGGESIGSASLSREDLLEILV